MFLGRHIYLKMWSVASQIQKKWEQNDKADPEKQPALGENDLKPSEGENHRGFQAKGRTLNTPQISRNGITIEI